MKINEFISNDLKSKFEIMDRNLYLETAHLSSSHQIENTPSFKSILENKYDMIHFLVDKVVKENSLKTPYFLLIQIISDGNAITKKNNGDRHLMKEEVKEWWESNRSKYGR